MPHTQSPDSLVRRYHDAWTSGAFDQAIACLAADVKVEVPIHEYPTRESFGEALARFGAAVEQVDLLTFCANGCDVVLVYDMRVRGLGSLRVAEHFTVREGRIALLRQVHDTAPIRAWLSAS